MFAKPGLYVTECGAHARIVKLRSRNGTSWILCGYCYLGENALLMSFWDINGNNLRGDNRLHLKSEATVAA